MFVINVVLLLTAYYFYTVITVFGKLQARRRFVTSPMFSLFPLGCF